MAEDVSSLVGGRADLRLRRPAFVLLTALWPVLWYLRTHGPAWPTQVLIPSFVLLVLSTVLAWGASPSPTTTRLTKAAFAFVAVGDVFINLTPWPGGSVPAFIGAHLCLAAEGALGVSRERAVEIDVEARGERVEIVCVGRLPHAVE